MFTGIIEEIGTVEKIGSGQDSARLTVKASRVLEDVHVGDSIAVNGICLTVTGFTSGSFTVDVMHETIKRSSFSSLRVGSRVNLERAMAADGRFGGHIVSGHIDGTGKIIKIRRDGIALWYTIETTAEIMKYIVEKGSVAISGISLTVAEVNGNSFSVSTIPHTNEVTVLHECRVGDTVNLENDIIGKYIERFVKGSSVTASGKGGITEEFLARCGF